MTNSAESLPSPTPVPKYVILDTKSILQQFRRSVNLSDRDINELLTQVFDELMDAVHWKNFAEQNGHAYSHRPNFSLLLRGRILQPSTQGPLSEEGEQVAAAYRLLYRELEHCVFQHMQEIVRLTQCFSYSFKKLRGDDVMLSYLSDQERPY